jgi:aminopeptidase-like protein
LDRLTSDSIGEEIFALAAKIFPLCRSITGDGVRQTLRDVAAHIDLQVHEVPTGTPVLDWTIPREWNIRDAFIKNSRGERIVDFNRSNLHVMSYSVPVHRHMSLQELQQHVHTLPEQPELIPYRTSYYAENWAFCMPHRQLKALDDDTYEVLIDSSLNDGYLTYGEFFHKGETDDEFLLTAHLCHPSLANDNCSGIALLTHLAEQIARSRTRYSYRCLFIPGTIGAIAWLARNEERVGRIKHGIVLSMVGDGGGPTYKKSRRGDAPIDRAMNHALRCSGLNPTVIEFSPYGYDERQFCSPGFNLPVGLFQRSRFGAIPQYHTSADNLEFIRPEHLRDSYRVIADAIEAIECDETYRGTVLKGEPQLGRRGLYGAIGGDKNSAAANMAMLWILNLSDGSHSLLDIAERADLPFAVVQRTAELLRRHDLLTAVERA